MKRFLDAFLCRRVHLTIESADRQSGFVLFGGRKPRHQFQRLYLGTKEPLPVHLALHRHATAEDCRLLARRFGLVVFCGDSAPAELLPELLAVPVLLDLERDTPAAFTGPAARWTRSAREDIRRARKSGFTYDVQTGDAWVDDFYERMYRPAMLHRHGREAYIYSRRQIRRLASAPGAELLRVLDNGTWIAGSLNWSTEQGYRLVKIGWVVDDSLVRRAMIGAVYYFNLQRAAVLTHARVCFGGVAPYLEDGLFRYKTKWGARLSADTRSYGDFRLLLDPAHPACRSFLRTHSIVVRGAGSDLLVISGGTPDTVGVESQMLAGLSRWYTWRDTPVPGVVHRFDDVPPHLRAYLSLHESLSVPARQRQAAGR